MQKLLLNFKKSIINLAIILMVSSSLAGCTALQEWFESMAGVQEEQDQ